MQEVISYEEIRDQKKVEYGTAFKDWIWIFVKQYKDRTHFLFELLQNAEDAKASFVNMSLFKDRLVIEHNGILFSKDDVVSITKVARSTKSGGGSIGKFGIGFKSVYAYTSTPKIYSGNYSFEIHDFIYPYEIKAQPVEAGITRIVIPFDNPEVSAAKAFSEISRALHEQISSDTILFLNNISKLEIYIENEAKTISITKEEREHPKGDGSVYAIKIRYDSRTRSEVEEDFLLFTDNEEEEIKLAFRIDGRELIPVKDARIFTFFPTDKESHQSFYIHAPFETTPARDNIVEDSEWNLTLVQNVCEGIRFAFCWLRDWGYLSIAGMNSCYPIYEYSEDTILHHIYETAIDLIESEENIIPTNKKDEFKSKSHIIMPENMTIADIFPDEDLQRLYVRHDIYWIAKDISRDSYHALREFLRKNFRFRIYTWRDILSKLDARFLEQKDKAWFEKLFPSIKSFCVTDSRNLGSHEVNVSSIPFVRLTTKKHICAAEGSERNVYLNNPAFCPNKIETDFLKSPAIYDFYYYVLRIPEYNIERDALDNVLPKYKTRQTIKVSNSDLKENIKDLKIIKDAIRTSPGLTETVRQYYIVTDGKEWFRPEELHIPSLFGGMSSIPEYALVKDVCKLKFIASGYEYDPKLDYKFFQAVGCHSSLIRNEIGLSRYLKLVRQYIGSKEEDEIRQKIFQKKYQAGIDWDWMYEGFPDVMENMTPEKSRKVASFLNRNHREINIRGEAAGADDTHFVGARAETMQIYSALGIVLTFKAWLYNKEGTLVAPASVHRRDLDPIYEKDSRKLLEILPFREEDAAFESVLSRIGNDADRETLRELLTNQESLSEVTKALQKKKIREMQGSDKVRNPNDALFGFIKSGGKKPTATESGNPDPVKNPDQRQKKLEEEFVRSLGRYKVPGSRLAYTYRETGNAEEKTFLANQYNGGHCQICDTAIVRKDGALHFQAINIIKTGQLADEIHGTESMGWNSLCLCPNCAAKYLYGSKDLSDFARQVMETEIEPGSDQYLNIQVELQGQQQIIRYAPKHILALKTVLQHYAEHKD